MLGFLKMRKARRAFDFALKGLLLGREQFELALRSRYCDRWEGFIEDVANGGKAQDEALALVTIFLLDAMGHDMSREQARRVVDTIYDKRFVERPPVFDVIDQVGYFAFLAENSGEATKGTVAMFFTELAKFFSDDVALQSRVREYFVEGTMRFRELAQDAVKAGHPPPWLPSSSVEQ
jgi:hypothetical protein